MVNRRIRKIILTVLLSIGVLPVLRAQSEAYNAYTPYSMYGIGNISKQGTAYNKSMGGVGVAGRDKRNINYLNPAAVTAREDKAFMADFGIAETNNFYKDGDYKSVYNTFNIYNFIFSFPVYKSIAMYAGFSPFSDLGYKVTSNETDPSLIGHTGSIDHTAQGYGSLSDVFVGAGATVVKGLSVGAEFQYIFGNLHKNNSHVFTNTSYRSIYSGYNMNLHAATVKFGVQYETPITSNVTVTAGATYRLKTNLRGTVRDFEYSSISSVTDTSRISIDTLSNNLGRVKLAGELGVGIALKGGDKWSAEIDYIRSDWASSGMDKVTGFATVGNAAFSASTSQSLRAGFSIVPNRNDIRYYRKRITYRAGAYWDQAYMNLDNNSVNAYGLTFGVTLPIFKWSNGLSLGVDFGQRGNTTGNMIRERYVNFNIGLNIFDIWFLKQKYE